MTALRQPQTASAPQSRPGSLLMSDDDRPRTEIIGVHRFDRRTVTVALTYLTGLLVISSVVLSGAAAGVADSAGGEDAVQAVAASDAGSITPEEALKERARARERLAELKRLDRSPMVSIDQNTIRSVRMRIENGNISYKRANYKEAKQHWQVAREQARAALVRHYAHGTNRYLNATAAYVAERKAAGYASPETARFSEQIQQLRNEEVSGLRDSRDRYQAARELNGEVESELPPMDSVKWANRLTPLWRAGAVGAGALLVLVTVAVSAGFRWGSGTAPSDETDGQQDEEEEPTPSVLRG